MKTLMILGAGYTQIPLFQAAKRLGVKTVAVSIPGPYDGFAYADEISYTDISDPEAVTKACQTFHADGIATCGLDLGMRAIGYACEALSLPGPSRRAAETVSDKAAMKKALTGGGVRTAAYFRISSLEELENAMTRLAFPVMLKAVDQMGGRGIFRCDTPEDARTNFARSLAASKKSYCVIEEFIDGELFGVEAMIQNGELAFFMPDNTEVFHGETDIPVGHSIPLHKEAERLPEIRRQVLAAIRAAGLNNCPVNADLIARGNDVYVVEITGRAGATGLSEIVSARFGVDYYEEIVKLALGIDVSGDFSPAYSGTVLTRTLTSDREGTVRRIENYMPAEDGILDLSFNVGPGDHVQPFTNGRDRIGQAILKTRGHAEEYLARIQRHLRIDLEGDLPLTRTPVEELFQDEGGNRIFIKREDLLPYSYGGNKVRFASAYLKDMKKKGADAMIMYGGYTSNLCRILSAACKERSIPCAMVFNVEDAEPDTSSMNASLIRAAGVREYRCTKESIAEAVDQAMADFRAEHLTPYYIHGDRFGRGNVSVPMASYMDVFYEILAYEREAGIRFDRIFLAGSTNTSQAGLLAAQYSEGDPRQIIGISVNRAEKRGKEAILSALNEFREKTGITYRLSDGGTPSSLPLSADRIHFTDRYLCGGYGKYSDEILNCIRTLYHDYGIGLDPVYSGKAFYGMTQYLKEHRADIAGGNILFIHTGGTPLFLDLKDKYML